MADREIVRQVIMALSFDKGGGPAIENERILTFQRLKHIVEEKVEVGGWTFDPDGLARRSRVRYSVRALDRPEGEFLDSLLELAAVDVLIVFMTGPNANVQFELSMRQVLRGSLILLVKDRESLPDAFGGSFYVNWDHVADGRVSDKIKKMAGASRRLSFDDPMTTDLKEAVSEDNVLATHLQSALQAFESPGHRDRRFAELLKHVSPGEVLSNWDTLFPISLVSITWSGRPGAYYRPEDALRGPLVHWANDRFLEMFGFHKLPDPTGREPLVAKDMIARLTELGCIDPLDLDDFVKEQGELMAKVFFEESDEPATVPLRFNAKASRRLRDRWLLPTVVGKNSIGPQNSTHSTFVAVVYSPVPNTRLVP